MIVTWTVCKVPISQRKIFSMKQEAWRHDTEAVGFCGRIGGWNVKKPTEASILTCWRDEQSYQQYQSAYEMEWTKKHNLNYHFTFQYEKILDIPGQERVNLFAPITKGGNLIKIGDIRVKQGHREQFMLVQQSVWNLSMSHAPGMMTGLFAQSSTENHHFLVVSRWQGEQEYQAYENHLLPKLLDWTYGADVREFQGRCIQLEQKWSVESR